MFVSIIIPVYNCEKYLADCLDSCVNQDLPADEYEILCINDGSTDSSLEILNKYANRYIQIKVFSQENQGVSAARNVGLENAKGEYIMFVDGDDLIRRDILGKLKELIVESNCDRLTMGGFTGNSDTINTIKGTVPEPNYSYPEVLWLNIYKRSIINEYQIRFVEGISHGEDTVFASDFRNFTTDLIEYSETVYFYRRHSNSAIDRKNQANLKSMILSYIKIVVLCKIRMNISIYNKDLNFRLWKKFFSRLMEYIPELTYSDRKEILSLLRKTKPYLYIAKSDKKTMDNYLYKCIKKSSLFRHMEVLFYSNAVGAHLIYVNNRFFYTKIGYILRHPRRFIKNPVKLIVAST